MPRPLPGGRSTCVGNISRSAELKVPTYAMSGAFPTAAEARDAASNDAPPASAPEVWRNARRENFGGVMERMLAVPVARRQLYSSGSDAAPIFRRRQTAQR